MSDCCSINKAPAFPAVVMSCPACGGRLKQVKPLTVKSLVPHLPFEMAPAQYYYCEAAACDVVYFPWNSEAPTFRRSDLLVLVGVKETVEFALVCYCFGVTRRQICDEIRQTGKSAVAERIKAEVKTGNCACEVENPSGRCCLGDVIRAGQEALRVPNSSRQNTLGAGCSGS